MDGFESIAKLALATGTLALALGACGDDGTMMPDQNKPLTAADVTFLLPLDSVADFGAKTTGGHGVLLTRERYDELERLTVVDEPDVLYDDLDVVAVRLDPCFFEGTGTPTCTSQIRLVLQPVLPIDGKTSTRDATVHIFYAVPEAEVRSLAAELQTLRLAASGAETIGLHPDPTAATAAVLPHIGNDRLTRITFVAVHASDQAWTFGGFDIANGMSKAIELPGGHHEQHLTSTGGQMTLDATILPSPTVEPAIINYLAEADRGNTTMEEQTAALAAFDRLLSPDEHNPGTVDCASCHMATTAKRFALPADMQASFSSAYANSQNQRMLGFFGTEVSVSPRVEAETQGVLKALAGQ